MSRRQLDQQVRAAVEQWTSRHAAVVVPESLRVRSGIGTRRGVEARVNRLERWLGGPKEAAAAIGVQPRTMRTWLRGGNVSKASREKLERAYDRTASARPEAQRTRLRDLLATGASTTAHVRTRAETQVAGYYNGQGKNGPASRRYPPEPGNHLAHRQVKWGDLDIRPVIDAYRHGAGEGAALEQLVSDFLGDIVFLNEYFNDPEVGFE